MALFSKPCCSNSRIDSILQNSILHFPTGMLGFLKSCSTYIGGFSLKLGSNATHLSKNATMFAKGCCIHGGMVFLMQSHFTSDVCMFMFLHFFIENINLCLFKMHMSKGTIAYVEGNSCRDVESIHF